MLSLNLFKFFRCFVQKVFWFLTFIVSLILNSVVFIFIIATCYTYTRFSYVMANQIVVTEAEIRNLVALAKTASEITISTHISVKDDHLNFLFTNCCIILFCAHCFTLTRLFFFILKICFYLIT